MKAGIFRWHFRAMRAAFEVLRERLQRLWKSGPAGAGKQLQEEQRSREVWQQCRVLASELGEAQAAYARRSAEEKCTGKEVVDELKAELKALTRKRRAALLSCRMRRSKRNGMCRSWRKCGALLK